MGSSLVETDIDIQEKLQELKREMEQVNGLKNEPQVDVEMEEISDEELDLNIESPVDSASLETLTDEVDAATIEDQPIDLPDSEEDDIQIEIEQEVIEAKDSDNLGEDEIGINIEGDDELWDEGDVEEIPLFEDEVLNEISEEESREEESSAATPSQDAVSNEEGEKNDAVSEKASDEESGGDGAGGDGTNDETDGANKSEEESVVAAANEKPGFMGLLPWLVTGLSSILILLAVIIIWSLWNNSISREQPSLSSKVSEEAVRPQPSNTQMSAKKSVGNTVSNYEAIDLAPFIIPGKSGGELVFFKLQVELIVPDATTKQELLRRQAWLRDIIYQELKGLDISRGVQGDILGRYKMPLLNRLNREFSPLRIEDIRLMGYLLR